MSVTLYREGLPRVSLSSPLMSTEGMLVGFVDDANGVQGILMQGDGSLTLATLGLFRVQFHYDVETDSWIDESKRDEKDSEVGVVGYEINFNRYFYTYEPPRPLEEIEADIKKIESEIMEMLRDVAG